MLVQGIASDEWACHTKAAAFEGHGPHNRNAAKWQFVT
jgi:hypothetical protein